MHSLPNEQSQLQRCSLRHTVRGEALGADVRHTELPGVSHNAWDHAYTDAERAT